MNTKQFLHFSSSFNQTLLYGLLVQLIPFLNTKLSGPPAPAPETPTPLLQIPPPCPLSSPSPPLLLPPSLPQTKTLGGMKNNKCCEDSFYGERDGHRVFIKYRVADPV